MNELGQELKIEKKPLKKLEVKDLLITFVGPIVIGKIFVLYFGTNYSSHPGDGYGYGLAISIGVTLWGFIRFLWKYRAHEEDETRP